MPDETLQTATLISPDGETVLAIDYPEGHIARLKTIGYREPDESGTLSATYNTEEEK